MKILRKSKTRHIYLVQKVLLQGELSYYIKKPKFNFAFLIGIIDKKNFLVDNINDYEKKKRKENNLGGNK